MKAHKVVLGLAVATSLTACGGTASLSAGRTTNSQGIETNEIKATVGISWGTRTQNRLSGVSLDVNELAIDIRAQGTTVLDNSGTGTLLVTQGGNVVGATPFTYVVMDSMAVAANPSALNAWLAQFPSADGYEVKLSNIQTQDTEEGVASLAVDTLYGTEVVASTTSTWPSCPRRTCGGGGGGGPLPENPQI